ncbi:phosphate ABC transporter substrate-binding protein PstS [Lichenicola sp.]|uniref:phosphate ABC transporter substrate-binding protein PstS n=1 Tax=Lichenicola sp. TaxID=2804529 RepID=UPI003B006478
MKALSKAARRTAACTTLASCLMLGLAIPAHSAPVTLQESGSTLLYPLFQSWIAAYDAAHPDTVVTAAATGSGKGISEAIAGHVQIGASDAYMSDQEAEQNPGILNIPLAISAQTINTNLPGLSAPLRIDGPTLAGIYSGRIVSWDAPGLAALNPGVALPHQPIVPIRRADASGDTFIFTQFLDFSTQRWEDGPGYGTSIAWPDVPGEKSVVGNTGMVHALQSTPYSIGYVGISSADATAKAGLGTAILKNQAGQFVTATPATIGAAASELDPRTPPDERLSLVFATGSNSYPLINYEYAIVSGRQADPATATALRAFLLWTIALDGGNAPAELTPVGFVALPDFIRALSEHQIARIR